MPIPIEYIGTSDTFGESGKPLELLKKYGLDTPFIVDAALKAIARKKLEKFMIKRFAALFGLCFIGYSSFSQDFKDSDTAFVIEPIKKIGKRIILAIQVHILQHQIGLVKKNTLQITC
jgi:hypothetical protein